MNKILWSIHRRNVLSGLELLFSPKVVNQADDGTEQPTQDKGLDDADYGILERNVHSDDESYIEAMQKTVKEYYGALLSQNGHKDQTPHVKKSGGHAKSQTESLDIDGLHLSDSFKC